MHEFTSYDNPLINKKEINEIANQMNETERQQEIFGKFVEFTGENPFAHQYDKTIHESEFAVHDKSKPIIISVDFNLNPFGVTFSHIYRDKEGFKYITFDEAEIENGSIPKMIELIKERYKPFLHLAILTGDAMGKNRTLMDNNASSYFEQLKRGLGMRDSQLKIKANPTHENSRSDCNYILFESKKHNGGIKVLLNPVTTKGTIRDLRGVQCDAFGQIMKKNRNQLNQRADLLDCWRYPINVFLKNWILENQRITKR